jgi:hypothetical protein
VTDLTLGRSGSTARGTTAFLVPYKLAGSIRMANDSTTPQGPAAQLSPLASASRSCSELLRRTMISQSILASALEIPKMSDAFRERTFREHVSGASGLREVFRDRKLFTGSYDPDRDFPKIADLFARQTAVNGETVIAGAVLVLSHSTADDVFTAACNLAVELDPRSWISEINPDRTVSVRDLRDKSLERIFEIELERLKKQIPDKSLPNRAELFFRHVPIVHNSIFHSTDPQYFRASMLKEVDDLRIDIVHRNGLVRANLKQSTEAMLFLHEAAVTALRSLGFAYSIHLDQSTLFPGAAGESRG